MGKLDGDRVLDVDSLTYRIREALKVREFQDILVQGQIEGLKRHSSGHVYFTLLGKSSRISCAMFRSSASSVLHWPNDGQDVAVRGGLGLYPPRGAYQLIVSRLYPLGVGDRARQKELLQKKLEEEGLFDERLKRPIPAVPSRVAVITSPTGAALQDVIRVSGERFPQCPLLIIPSVVQGVEAPGAIVSSLRKASAMEDLSCVMLVRGGGSRDDLDPFDDEDVARAIRACPFPVVTGVGHQVDLTIADMAADLSAPTPSGAAERVFPDRRDLLIRVAGSVRLSKSSVQRRITVPQGKLLTLKNNMTRSIHYLLDANGAKVSDLLRASKSSLNLRVTRLEGLLGSLDARIRSLSPLWILGRGYAEVEDMEGRKIVSAQALAVGQRVVLRFKDGAVLGEVIAPLPLGGDVADA
ncbi:MAG: exodeoxyribonuclease VII large subunit [Thermanaerothrix sp.]|nr:exodeoxyribonuclease VII large subunit [Thermanaerothrix sp.]